MTTTTETPAFTETFLQLLQLLAPGRGNLSLHIRTLHGIGVVQPLRVRPVPECLSPPLLEFLDGEFEIRSQIVTVETDASPVEMTAAAVIFRLPTKFSKETEWRHAVDQAAAEQIRDALAAFPLPPAYAVDGGHELAVFWPLTEPLLVNQDPAPALALLEALVTHLGADVEAARSLATTFPLAGIVRNWNNNPPERMGLLAIAPGATYTAEALLQAITPEDADTRPGPGGRSRKATAR